LREGGGRPPLEGCRPPREGGAGRAPGGGGAEREWKDRDVEEDWFFQTLEEFSVFKLAALSSCNNYQAIFYLLLTENFKKALPINS
jgi:hypothetical protein